LPDEMPPMTHRLPLKDSPTRPCRGDHMAPLRLPAEPAATAAFHAAPVSDAVCHTSLVTRPRPAADPAGAVIPPMIQICPLCATAAKRYRGVQAAAAVARVH
jgi:hypothetical protein